MPRGRSKAGVNWLLVRQQWEAGSSEGELAKRWQVSRQAIAQRRLKDGWERPEEPVGEDWLEETRQLPSVQGMEDPETRAQTIRAAFGNRTPEKAARILAYIEAGLPIRSACRAANVSEDLYQVWRKEDPDLSALHARALSRRELRRVQTIETAAEGGSWQAASWLLERSPDSRDTWGAGGPGAGAGGIQVTINVGRASAQADAEVIDVTPSSQEQEPS